MGHRPDWLRDRKGCDMTARRYSFGAFELDGLARRLVRDGEPVALSSRHLDVLLSLVSRAGVVVSKDALVNETWRGIAVTDNSLEQAISAIRRALGANEAGVAFIETVPRQGYRFAVPVTMHAVRASDADLERLVAPHRAWIEGRAALETFDRTAILHAREVFERLIDDLPDEAPVHVGLANACLLQFEMTRADRAPDLASLSIAERHAREACRLDAAYGEAWATLGVVLDRSGQTADGLAATRRAVTLEPDNWRHHFRHALVGWGEERLRAARRTLSLLPGFPLAHYLAATVHVARQAFDAATHDLAEGLAADRARTADAERFGAVGLHWLDGLVALARGDEGRALASLEQELAADRAGHLYARECAANASYAVGAIHLRAGRKTRAVTAFDAALAHVTAHPMALLGRAAAMDTPIPSPDLASDLVARRPSSTVDAAVWRAAREVVAIGDAASGAASIDAALADAAPGPAGWLIPVEPLLRVSGHLDAWTAVLARLRARAA
jgi:DNA-binding winged helix-turn-helix (wHTH) protein